MGHRRAWRILLQPRRQSRLVVVLLTSPSRAQMDRVVPRVLRATPQVAAVDSFRWPAAITAARREVPAGKAAVRIPVPLPCPSPVATPSSVAPPAVCAAGTAMCVLRPRRYPAVETAIAIAKTAPTAQAGKGAEAMRTESPTVAGVREIFADPSLLGDLGGCPLLPLVLHARPAGRVGPGGEGIYRKG